MASSILAPSLSLLLSQQKFAIRCLMNHKMKPNAGQITKIGTNVNTYFFELEKMWEIRHNQQLSVLILQLRCKMKCYFNWLLQYLFCNKAKASVKKVVSQIIIFLLIFPFQMCKPKKGVDHCDCQVMIFKKMETVFRCNTVFLRRQTM